MGQGAEQQPPQSLPAPAASYTPATPAPAPPQMVQPDPAGRAHVTLFVSQPGAWLELRSLLLEGPWQRVCMAPCNRPLEVEGMEARVCGPGMTSSNAFRIEPGRGRAKIRVDAGSSTARTLGITGLVLGTPVAMAGMAMYGYGASRDTQSMQTAGAVTLSVGAVIVVAALPLLALGSTTVRDSQGEVIASRRTTPRM
jgi:hypothetical protein